MTAQVSERLSIDGQSYRFHPFPPLPKHGNLVIANPLWEATSWYYAVPDAERAARDWWEVARRGAPKNDLLRLYDFIERCSVNPAMKEEITAVLNSKEPSFGISTACRRNYVGTWKVEKEQLHLCHLSLFHGRVLNGPDQLLADWVTGTFIGGFGSERNRHYGDSAMTKGLLLEFREGRLIRKEELQSEALDKMYGRTAVLAPKRRQFDYFSWLRRIEQVAAGEEGRGSKELGKQMTKGQIVAGLVALLVVAYGWNSYNTEQKRKEDLRNFEAAVEAERIAHPDPLMRLAGCMTNNSSSIAKMQVAMVIHEGSSSGRVSPESASSYDKVLTALLEKCGSPYLAEVRNAKPGISIAEISRAYVSLVESDAVVVDWLATLKKVSSVEKQIYLK